jgi:hypothetical protein
MKRLIPVLLFFLVIIPNAHATMGIGITPTNNPLFFENEDEQIITAKIINSGNMNLLININSNLTIIPSKNNFILSSCSCKNYCDIHVVECSALYPPEEVTIRIKNPRKPIIEYIKFSGSIVGGSDSIIAIGVSAEIRLNISYNGKVPTQKDDVKKNENTVILTSIPPTNLPKTTTTQQSTTTVQPTTAQSVVEPSDQQKPKSGGLIVQEAIESIPLGKWIEDNQLLVATPIIIASASIGGVFLIKRKKNNEPQKFDNIQKLPVYVETIGNPRVGMSYSTDQEPIIIDETKEK